MSSDNSQQLAESVATNLAFGMGEGGPFIAAGISLFYGLFGSTPNNRLVEAIKGIIDGAVQEMKAFAIQQKIEEVDDHTTAFLETLSATLFANDNTPGTLKNQVDNLSAPFGGFNMTSREDLLALAHPEVVAASTYIDFASDNALHALVAVISVRIAAAHAIILGGLQIWQELGPANTVHGVSSPSVDDDTSSHFYMQAAIDAYRELARLIFGRQPVRRWTKLPGDRLNYWDQLLPGQYLAAAGGKYYCALRNDGTLAVYAGGSPDDCQGIVWVSAPSQGAPKTAYLVLQSDMNVCIYDISGDGQSPGPTQGPLLWMTNSWATHPCPSAYLQMTDSGALALFGDVEAIFALRYRVTASQTSQLIHAPLHLIDSAKLVPATLAGSTAVLATLQIRARTLRESERASGSTGYLLRAPTGHALSSLPRIRTWILGRVGRPGRPATVIDPSKPITVESVLGGLHVDYGRTA